MTNNVVYILCNLEKWILFLVEREEIKFICSLQFLPFLPSYLFICKSREFARSLNIDMWNAELLLLSNHTNTVVRLCVHVLVFVRVEGVSKSTKGLE